MLNPRSVYDDPVNDPGPTSSQFGIEDHHQYFMRLISHTTTVEELYILHLQLANDLEQHDTFRPIRQRLEALIDKKRQRMVNNRIPYRVTWTPHNRYSPSVCAFHDWTDSELIELLEERIAIIQHEGQAAEAEAEKMAFQWLGSVIGEKRLARITSYTRSNVDPTQDTPEKTTPENSNLVMFATADIHKGGCRMREHPTA